MIELKGVDYRGSLHSPSASFNTLSLLHLNSSFLLKHHFFHPFLCTNIFLGEWKEKEHPSQVKRKGDSKQYVFSVVVELDTRPLSVMQLLSLVNSWQNILNHTQYIQSQQESFHLFLPFINFLRPQLQEILHACIIHSATCFDI